MLRYVRGLETDTEHLFNKTFGILQTELDIEWFFFFCDTKFATLPYFVEIIQDLILPSTYKKNLTEFIMVQNAAIRNNL